MMMMIQVQNSRWSWKLLALACLLMGAVILVTMSTKSDFITGMVIDHVCAVQTSWPQPMGTEFVNKSGAVFTGTGIDHVSTGQTVRPRPMRTEFVDNSGAAAYIKSYSDLFAKTTPQVAVSPDPNNSSTITTWWQALAMIDWYMKGPVRYKCKNKKDMGNWYICQDEPYTIKPPCLVYSFGINWEYTFDDAMIKLGCEVHMFDPSMKEKDHKRGNNATFHNMGIGSFNTDAFVPRHDGYVKDNQTWTIRTVKAIMKELGHENRVIDVFKMDVESTEWTVIDNMLETEVFMFIRQFDLEYHLFHDFPLPQEYIHIYKVFTRLREIGFREYFTSEYKRDIKLGSFRYQTDAAYVNALFDKRNFQT